uniref:Candidate secreted effector n=1 Tax=Meloidogyne incognita TaxID=6306 RepID=A0A914M0Z0_MELIC
MPHATINYQYARCNSQNDLQVRQQTRRLNKNPFKTQHQQNSILHSNVSQQKHQPQSQQYFLKTYQ